MWIWLCAYLNCAGWALSALHQLNAGGYAVVLAIWLLSLFILRKFFPSPPSCSSRDILKKNLRRFRRPFPLAFLALATLAFLGGVLYAPTNYDALAYRLPRVLHWLDAGQWHWIHTSFDRLNTRAAGIEWISAPLLALLKTDRLLFLINTLSFLLLPGLVFSVFTRLGVRRRVAWTWMWLAPTAYGCVLQAGSIGNDLFGAVFALAAVDFALRAKKSGSAADLFTSVLAAALLTGAKLSNLPLLLPWALAILPSLKLFFRWPVGAAAVGVIALVASALPTIYLNARFAHDWSGAGLNHGHVQHAALIKAVANTGLLTIHNFTPPVFPFGAAWERGVSNLIPASVTKNICAVMVEPRATRFSIEEMQMEENAGLGFGVSALLLLSVLVATFVRQKKIACGVSLWLVCVRWSPLLALLAVMTQSNLFGIARILTPYYLLLLPMLLAFAGHEQLVKKRWWRAAAFALFFFAAGLLVISPARPLWPAQSILKKFPPSNSRLLTRMQDVYSVYGRRNDAFAPVRDLLPPDWKVLGLVTYDDPETSLWRPFGTRRVEHVCPGDTAADLRVRGVEYVLLQEPAFAQRLQCPLPEWLQQMNATVVGKISLRLRAATDPLEWQLVRLN